MVTRIGGTGSGTGRSPRGEDRESRGWPAHDVFVSYTAHDKPTADAIVSRLEQAGIRCWVAPRDVMPGKVFGEAIEQAIETSRLMVVVFSGETNQSHHVHREVERAVANDVVIIPFRIEPAEPAGAMAYFLSSEHWLDAMTPPLDDHISQLVSVAHVLLGSAQRGEQGPKTAPAAPPSRGRQRWPSPVLIAAASVAFLGLVGGLLYALVFSGSAQPKAAPRSPAHSATAQPGTAQPGTAQPSTAQPSAARPEMVVMNGLRAGECLETPQAYDQNASSRSRFWGGVSSWPTSMPVVPCGDRHSAEVFFSANVWAENQAYPGENSIDQQSSASCNNAFYTYVGIAYDKSVLDTMMAYPSPGTWANGDRKLICIAYNPNGSEPQQSIRGSGQ
jgi:hypothetical protein